MRRMAVCLFASTVCLISANARSQDCNAILTHGLRNISISRSAEALTAAKYYNHCQKDFSKITDQQMIQAEIEVFGYGSGSGGFSREKTEENLKQWCTSNSATASSNRASVQETQTFYQGAVSAWQACTNLALRNIRISPIISPDGRTIDIGVYYPGPSSSGVMLTGIETENFSCQARFPETDTTVTFPYNVGSAAVQIRCKREAPKQEIMQGVTYERVPRATIAVQTASDPFQLYFAEEWNPPAPLTEVQRLIKVMAEEKLPVGTVISSTLTYEQFTNPLNGTYSPNRWIPADGRDLPAGTLYESLTGSKKAPDLKVEEKQLLVTDIIQAELASGANISTLSNNRGNGGAWTWQPSVRRVIGNRPYNDWENDVDEYEVYLESNGVLVAKGRTHSWKEGRVGAWTESGNKANIIGISTKRNSLQYYVRIN